MSFLGSWLIVFSLFFNTIFGGLSGLFLKQNYTPTLAINQGREALQPSASATSSDAQSWFPTDCSKNGFSTSSPIMGTLSSVNGNITGYLSENPGANSSNTWNSYLCIVNTKLHQGNYYFFDQGDIRALSRDGSKIYYMQNLGGNYEGHGDDLPPICDTCGLHLFDTKDMTDSLIEKDSQAGWGIFWSDPYVDLAQGLYLKPVNSNDPYSNLQNALLILNLPSARWEYLTYGQVNLLPTNRKFILPDGYVFDTAPGHEMRLSHDGVYLNYSVLNPKDVLVNGRLNILTGENALPI